MRTTSEDRDSPGVVSQVPEEVAFEEGLRRALRQAADYVEPAGDGLTQIFRRLAAPRPFRRVSLLVTDCADLVQLIVIGLRAMSVRASSVLAAAGSSVRGVLRWLTSPATPAPVDSRHHRGQDPGPGSWGRPHTHEGRARLRTAVAWLRPAMATAVTAVVVMTGAVALSQTVARIEASANSPAVNSTLAGTTPATGGHRQSRASDLSPANGGGTHQHSCAATRCPPRPARAPASKPSTQATASPTASGGTVPKPTRRHHHHPRQHHSPPQHGHLRRPQKRDHPQKSVIPTSLIGLIPAG